MLKKSIRAIAAAAVLCVTAMFSGVTVSADSEELNSRLDQLEWGMTLEEVEAIMGTPYEKEENFVSGSGQVQTLLTYIDAECMGHDGYVILCYTEENGFEAVNFHIPGDVTLNLAYPVLFAQLKEECTEYEETTDTLSLFHFDNDNYTIFLADFGSEVQVSYFPLFDKAGRENAVKGGGAAVIHEPSPETDNASAAVYACITALAGMVMMLTKKESDVKQDAV